MPGGKLDRSFGGGDGTVLTLFGPGESIANAVVLLGGGRFAVAGSHGPASGEVRFAVARYRADGRPDKSFGGNGKVLTGFRSGQETSSAVDLLRYGDDWLVAVGSTDGSGGSNVYDIALARYRANGSRDPLFGGGDGKVVEDVGDMELAYAAVLQRNNFILIVANSVVGGDWDATFVRLNASGNLDAAWGSGGVVTHELGADEWWYDLVRAGGKAVAVGEVGNDAAVLRIRKNGTLDPFFGPGGLSVTPFPGGDSWLYGATLQRDGRIVAVGTAPATLSADGFAVERLLAG